MRSHRFTQKVLRIDKTANSYTPLDVMCWLLQNGANPNESYKSLGKCMKTTATLQSFCVSCKIVLAFTPDNYSSFPNLHRS